MPRVRFCLALSEEQYLGYYRGEARAISVVADDGRRVEFPASSLRPYITRQGIRGRFELHFAEDGKFIDLHRIDL